MFEDNYSPNPYFTREELECKGNGELRLHPGFLGELIHLRRMWAAPMYINSCCRSPEHNEEVGGSKNSYHLTQQDTGTWKGTLAIDIGNKSFDSASEKESFVKFAEVKGWSTGVYDWGVHIDKRTMTGAEQVSF